jgi:hypothetical protein
LHCAEQASWSEPPSSTSQVPQRSRKLRHRGKSRHSQLLKSHLLPWEEMKTAAPVTKGESIMKSDTIHPKSKQPSEIMFPPVGRLVMAQSSGTTPERPQEHPGVGSTNSHHQNPCAFPVPAKMRVVLPAICSPFPSQVWEAGEHGPPAQSQSRPASQVPGPRDRKHS